MRGLFDEGIVEIKPAAMICRLLVVLLGCVVCSEIAWAKSDPPIPTLKRQSGAQKLHHQRERENTSRPAVLTPTELAKRALPSVVSVLVDNANGRIARIGSGFLVRADVVATNYHVIETAASVSQITAKVAGKDEVYGVQGILGADEEKDLALLRVAGIKGRSLSLGTARRVAIGEAVYVVGSPEGLEGTFSPGIVSSIRRIAGHDLIQITAPVSHGSSGGPVLNSSGEVIGIITAAIEEGQNLNFAIPVKYLTSLIAESFVTERQTLANSYVDRGNRYVEQKLWAKALQAYKQAISIDRKYSVPYYCLGHTYHEMHRYIEAVQAYRQAIGLEPNNESLYAALGYAQEKLGRFSEALEAYKQANRINPDASSYSSLGDAYAGLGKYERAMESYKQAIHIEPDAFRYASLGDVLVKLRRNAEAIDAYKESVRIEPEPWSYMNLGNLYRQLGRSDEARATDEKVVRAYKEAIRVVPTGWNYRGLGDSYRRLGKYADAIEAYKEAIRLEPESYWVSNQVGLVYEALNRYAEAAEFYIEYAAKTKEKNTAAYRRASLGRTYYEMAEYKKALDVYNKVIRNKPNYAYAHHMLGKVYRALGRTVAAKLEQERALTLLKRAVRADPTDVSAHLGLYSVYLEVEDRKSAKIEYRILEELVKDNPDDLKEQLGFGRGEFYK